MPESTLQSFAGDEHCGWEDSTWVEFAGAMYLSDPRQVVYGTGDYAFPDGAPRIATKADLYQVVEELPPGALDTGFRRGELKLWISPQEEGDAIYVVTGDLIERLPRTLQGCD